MAAAAYPTAQLLKSIKGQEHLNQILLRSEALISAAGSAQLLQEPPQQSLQVWEGDQAAAVLKLLLIGKEC